MLNLETIPEHIREWAEKDLIPLAEETETRLTALENAAKTQAHLVLTAAQRELARAQAMGPVLGAKADEVIAAAEKGVADAEAFLQSLGGA